MLAPSSGGPLSESAAPPGIGEALSVVKVVAVVLIVAGVVMLNMVSPMH
jgi:hypothetical protein